MRSRSEPRSSLRRSRAPAKRTARRTYSAALGAIHSGRPTALSTLVALRETDREPGTVTTGTPIQRASQVVVRPLYGMLSCVMYAASNQRWYACCEVYGTHAISIRDL